MDLLIGGISGVGAVIFTNPLEVLKVRMQLQGELKGRGNYIVHYRNTFHAAYVIGRNEGLRALQKGLVPAIYYQFVINATRLGSYQLLDNQGFVRNPDGKINNVWSLIIGALCGSFASVIVSPLFLIKTHLQAKANQRTIAVGHQHNYDGIVTAIKQIYGEGGVRGLWRGTTSAIPRACVTSSVQITMFQKSLEFMRGTEFLSHYGPWTSALISSFTASIFGSIINAPFDVTATRFYNQGVDKNGKGLLYRSVFDCMYKTYLEEGLRGFYKGFSALYFRLGPHTLLTLAFWDRLKNYYNQYEKGQG